MIDPQWSVIDLDPHTWRSIGRYFDPGQYIRAAQPDEHGLFVLHDGGRVLRVVDSAGRSRRDLDLGQLDAPAALADELYARGEWQRVHVIDRRHLASVARQAQSDPRRDMATDDYYHLVYNLLWAGDGYATAPARAGHWNGWTYGGLEQLLAALPDPVTLALVVVDGERTEIGLLADVRDGLIRVATTLEAFAFPAPQIEVSAAGLMRLWSLLAQRHAEKDAPASGAALLLTAAAFEELMIGPDKLAALQKLGDEGAALWRLGAYRET